MNIYLSEVIHTLMTRTQNAPWCAQTLEQNLARQVTVMQLVNNSNVVKAQNTTKHKYSVFS